MSVEDILRGAIERQSAMLDESDAEVKRMADKHFRVIGDPNAVAADLSSDGSRTEPEVTA